MRVWTAGEIVTWRGIFRGRIWHAIPVIVVKDLPEQIVLALLPGAAGFAPEDYAKGKGNGKRRWDFKDQDWRLEQHIWQMNRVLILLEPDCYFATMLFWRPADSQFLGYYINFQLPFRRRARAVDLLDLELDLVIHPDLSFEWKDEDEYETAIARGVMTEDWRRGVDAARQESLRRLETRRYPLDGSWIDWQPPPDWRAPALPAGWDRL